MNEVQRLAKPTSLVATPIAVRGGLLQRKCACGQHTVAGGECTECRKKREATLQRAAVNASAAGAVPPIVHEVLRAPGQSLDGATRAFMEPRFGYDFSGVRVHSDSRAAESARAVNALAYTVGSDIVFGEGQYPRPTTQGRRLLAHELTHVLQQSSVETGGFRDSASAAENVAEREADAVAAGIVASSGSLSPVPIGQHARALYRQQPTGTQATAPVAMTRAAFESAMLLRFGVRRITTGTMQEQMTRLTPRGGMPAGGITLPNWQSWDPGPSSPIYQSIIESFEDFANTIGGVPVVDEITFFNMSYEVNQAGVGKPRPEDGAKFGGGHMTIYRALSATPKALPISRSNPQGRYPSVVIGVSGIPGQSPGAPLPFPSLDKSVRRLIIHELGHGLAEAAMGPNAATAVDPHMIEDYRRAVGWTSAQPPQLFDIGVAAVEAAFKADTPPPAAYQITENDWNAPKWKEQPISDYMVSGGPAEDFAEAAMAFVEDPALLRSRSPRRFKFLNDRKALWLPRLLKPPPVGDFPEPRKRRSHRMKELVKQPGRELTLRVSMGHEEPEP